MHWKARSGRYQPIENEMKQRRENFLVYGAPLLEQEEMDEVMDTIRSGWLGTGPKTKKFEKMMCEYTGAKYAVAVSSCTAALHLSMMSSGVGPGDEVITTPMTFCATANSVIHTGATPKFVDVFKDTMLMDPSLLEAAITPNTKAIIPIHLSGRMCDLDAIHEIAGKHGITVIEDAAHCIEGTYKGRKVGSISHLTAFSFYVTKNLTTTEGGMILTDDEELASKLSVFALHGMSKDAWKRFSSTGYSHYEVVLPGYKCNMTDMQASLGIHQLNKLERMLVRRNEIWARYQTELQGLGLGLPAPDDEGNRHARHLYTVMVDKDACGVSRDEMLTRLNEEKIGSGVHYTALHLHPYYRERFGYKPGDFPNTEWIGDRTLTLPLSAKLTDDDVDDVIWALRRILA